MFDSILKHKNNFLSNSGHAAEYAGITVDSPLPYDVDDVLAELDAKDEEKLPGARPGTEKAGPLNGKLTRFLQRLRSKRADKRLNFMFNGDVSLRRYEWLDGLAEALIGIHSGKGLKIIDFSAVPSDDNTS